MLTSMRQGDLAVVALELTGPVNMAIEIAIIVKTVTNLNFLMP